MKNGRKIRDLFIKYYVPMFCERQDKKEKVITGYCDLKFAEILTSNGIRTESEEEYTGNLVQDWRVANKLVIHYVNSRATTRLQKLCKEYRQKLNDEDQQQQKTFEFDEEPNEPSNLEDISITFSFVNHFGSFDSAQKALNLAKNMSSRLN